MAGLPVMVDIFAERTEISDGLASGIFQDSCVQYCVFFLSSLFRLSFTNVSH